LLSRQQNAGQNRDLKLAKRSFEKMSQFKFLGMTVLNENLIQEEIKRRFTSGNALRSFCPEPSVFSLAEEQLKYWNTQDYAFACGSVWV
jgi:hypothetical protein